MACASTSTRRYVGRRMLGLRSVGSSMSAGGQLISEQQPERAMNFAIWWDGDLLRESLDHARPSTKWNPAAFKFENRV